MSKDKQTLAMEKALSTFDVSEGTEGDLLKLAEFFMRLGIDGLLESLRHGKVWAQVQNAVEHAGMVIVTPVDRKTTLLAAAQIAACDPEEDPS